MTDEEYYELVSTFKPNFTPSGVTCRKYDNGPVRNCKNRKYFNSTTISCDLYVSYPKTCYLSSMKKSYY